MRSETGLFNAGVLWLLSIKHKIKIRSNIKWLFTILNKYPETDFPTSAETEYFKDFQNYL